MALFNNGRQILKLYKDGVPITKLYNNGALIWTQEGPPTISSFTITPDKLLDSSSQRTAELRFNVSGSERNVIIETLSDGTIRNVPLSGMRTVINVPATTAKYTLTSRNINGVTTREITFTRGTAPVITTWQWGSFQQGIGAISPDSVLLEWAVTGSPAPRLEISPDIFYHPDRLSGSYRLSRVGAGLTQTLTLTATNTFRTVRRSLTINWPPRQEG